MFLQQKVLLFQLTQWVLVVVPYMSFGGPFAAFMNTGISATFFLGLIAFVSCRCLHVWLDPETIFNANDELAGHGAD